MVEEQKENVEPTPEEVSSNRKIRQIAGAVIGIIMVFMLGMGSGYLTWGNHEIAERKQQKEAASLYEQVSPADGYHLPISYGDLGPQLIQAGVINYDAFAAIYKNSGDPLSAEQISILQNGSNEEIVIDAQNAHFLLNFFWAVGLANNNPILTEEAMVQYKEGQIEGFASTGGWGLATRPIIDIYASMDLIPLTAEQQRLVADVASQIYRPCCNNHTAFPDCNHGMAMLGILELMASQGADADQMFEAAKYINAYWFPQQTLEAAMYLKTNQNIEFVDVEARLIVGEFLSSASGSQMVRQDLQSRGLLQQAPGQGGSCAN